MRGLRRTWIVLFSLAGLAVVLVGGAVGATGETGPNGVTATPGREPDSNGYYTSQVTITFSGLAEADTCNPAQEVYSGDPVSSTCTDAADPPQPYTDTFDTDDFPYDDEKPILSAPNGPITEEATSSQGAVVTFNVSAEDEVDPEPDVSCSPKESGDTFPIDTTEVTCTAADEAGHTAEKKFDVVVKDTTPPEFGSAPAVTKEGNVVGGYQGSAYSKPAASDNVDGTLPPGQVSCNPGPGAKFDLGQTTVACTAADSATPPNTSTVQFTVTVKDTTPPEFGSAPDVTQEGNVAGGYQGTAYSKPEAFDVVDGPLAPGDITCVPGPGAKFDLDTTEVTCTATDDAGNPSAEKKFDVTVTDKTAPEFLVQPQEVTVQAKNADTGTPATNPCIQSFLNAPTASDVVEGDRPVTNDAPDQFPVGDTEVTFTTSDTNGNTKTAKALVKIRKGPQGACTIDDKAPRNARRVTASERNKLVLLRWRNPTGADFFRVEIRRNTANAPTAGPIVYKGRREALRDRDVRNGVSYRYVVYAVDEAGNHRGGIPKLATPHRILLLRPRDEARVLKSRPPTLQWVEKKRARYYNVQLYRMVKGNPRKVLSRWPAEARYKLTRTWRFEGRRYRLGPGRYVWYVWPGLGPRSAGSYGDMMGSSAFRVVKRR